MYHFSVKAVLSGILIAIVADVSRRFPSFGGLIASLPLISVIGMIWLWRDTGDPDRLSEHAVATFWFVLPSLPMLLVIPALLRRGLGFYPTLAVGCALTIVLYLAMVWLAPRLGMKL